jgi:phenolic acid decarboxylase
MNTLGEITPNVLRIIDQYNKHRERCVKWKKEHPEKNCAYVNKYYSQMKEESPEKYKEYLAKQKGYYDSVKNSPENVAKRKEYYENVTKPKKALLKQQAVPQTI